MQVRLAFSVATILAESDILLIDEVLAVGDADFQRKCFEYFKKLKKDKKTVVFVSHDMSAVREYCDRAILINDSKVVFSGSSEETAKEYTKLFSPAVYEAVESEDKIDATKKTKLVSKWGSGGVDIVDIKLSKKVYTLDDKDIEISHRIIGEVKFDDTVNPGFVIKNENGQPVCGTNTDITLGKSKKLFLNKSDNTMTVKWVIPNLFNKGKYTIDIAVLSGSNSDTLQWWDECVSFRVINDKSTPYPVSPTVEVKIN